MKGSVADSFCIKTLNTSVKLKEKVGLSKKRSKIFKP